MTAPTVVPEFLYRIAIEGIPLELQSLRPGGIYWLNMTQWDDCLLVSRCLLKGSGAQARGVLINANGFVLPEEDDLLAELSHDLVAFTLTENSLRALRALPHDLDRTIRPSQRTILLRLPSIVLAHADHVQLRAILTTWQTWLANVDCAMVVLNSGDEVPSVTPNLLEDNDLLSGLVFIKRGDLYLLTYQCIHWRSALGVVVSRTLSLKHTEYKLSVDGLTALTEPFSLSDLPGRCIVESVALEGFAQVSQKGWDIVDSSAAAFELARTVTNATVLFALRTQSELPELAKTLHALRLERGPILRLVVRELSTPLRLQDEQKLLDCGANLVIGGEMGYTRFWSLIESIQSLRYNRKLVESPEILFQQNLESNEKGIITAAEFIRHVKSIVSGKVIQQIPGVLVRMRPVPGLTTDQTLKLLNLRRLEDIACKLQGHLHLFLHSCLPSMTNVVLNQLFVLPFDEIFSAHTVYEDEQSINAAIEQMQIYMKSELNHPTIINEEINLESNVESLLTAASAFRTERYSPKRITLTIGL